MVVEEKPETQLFSTLCVEIARPFRPQDLWKVTVVSPHISENRKIREPSIDAGLKASINP